MNMLLAFSENSVQIPFSTLRLEILLEGKELQWLVNLYIEQFFTTFNQ